MELKKNISKKDEKNWKLKLKKSAEAKQKKEKTMNTGPVSVANIDKVLQKSGEEKNAAKQDASIKVIKQGKPWTKELKKSSKAVSKKKIATAKREKGKIKKLEKNEAAKSALRAKKSQKTTGSSVKKSKETKKEQVQVVISPSVKKLFAEAVTTWGNGASAKNSNLVVKNEKLEVRTAFTERKIKGFDETGLCIRFSRSDGQKVKNWLLVKGLSRFELCQEILKVMK